MKPSLKFLAFVLLPGALVYISCKKEYSCEDCADKNKPPIANAGSDQNITLQTDSAFLDGSASSDPDGSITSFLWTKISGPASSIIMSTASAKTPIKNLIAGVYQFELKVTDNGGLSARDTMRIVNAATSNNLPPVSMAGNDTTIQSNQNPCTTVAVSIALNGSNSYDPDGTIVSYLWTGPLNISSPNTAITQVNNLLPGTYTFILKITDNYGATDGDTVLINIVDNNRPLVNAQLIPVGILSVSRYGTAMVSVANKILFAGGFNVYGYTPASNVSRVDILDVVTNSWSTAELSQPRSGITTAVLGNKVFFAGGAANTATGYSSRVDIYDAVTNTWTTTELSSGAIHMTGAAVGNKVLFTGGFREYGPSRRVDIYDVSTNTWTQDSLTNRTFEAVYGISVTVIGSKIYFAGAAQWAWDFGENSSTINIYDVLTGNWSISALSVERGLMADISVGNKNYWAGGDGYPESAAPTNLVEIKDMNTGISEFSCLFQANAELSAVQRNNDIVFFTGNWGGLIQNKFDIYHLSNGNWSIGVLPIEVEGASIVIVNNTIYIGCGKINGNYSSQVWKLEF